MEHVPKVSTAAEEAPVRRSLLRTLVRDRLALLGLVVLGALLLVAVLPLDALPGDPFSPNLRARLMPPAWLEGGTWQHPLGTDNLGRDMLSRIMRAARVSLTIAFSAVVISAALGIGLGVTSGFFAGRTDALVMRIVDIQLAFPLILMIIAIVAVVGPSIPLLIVVLGLSGWGQYARLVRAETLRIKTLEYVEAARATGSGTFRIIWQHVLPNASSTIVIFATFEVARILLLESAVSFLGLGVQPPTPSWGTMISDGRNYLYQGWWISTFSGAAVVLSVLALNFLGDGLRDTLDPRSQ
jgi:ABC-type dipeptide/oligopeptide/nickel transport system permease subunit